MSKVEKVITALAWVAIALFGSMLDSDSCIPMIICGVCSIWILLVALGRTAYE